MKNDIVPAASVGLDIAKTWFQVHGADAEGKPVFRHKLRRDQLEAFFQQLPATVIGMEACATAHHWARTLTALGHQVRLLPPQYVKPFVKRSKTDSADAEAICEAMRRSGIRDVPVKTCEQQGSLTLHRARDLLVRQRTMLTNALRGFAAEFGLIVGQGAWNVVKLREVLHTASGDVFPEIARATTQLLFAQLDELGRRIETLEKQIMAWHRASPESRRLATIPGIGPINATLMAATVPDPRQFKSGREFAAWIGLVPKETSSGGKQRLGHISKRGNPYMRRLLIVGAHAVLRWTKRGKGMQTPWLLALIERRPPNVVAVAIANKMARIAWALMMRNETYRSATA
jgi:transposase